MYNKHYEIQCVCVPVRYIWPSTVLPQSFLYNKEHQIDEENILVIVVAVLHAFANIIINNYYVSNENLIEVLVKDKQK